MASNSLRAAFQGDHVRGDLGKAKIVLVEYADYQCLFCARHHLTMTELARLFGDSVAWVYRHFPLPMHPEALPAAMAAECASEQDKFWEYTDALYTNQEKLDADFYGELAESLGVDPSMLDVCMANNIYADKVADDMAAGRKAGVTSTPTTFVGDRMIPGAVPMETLAAAIEAALAKQPA